MTNIDTATIRNPSTGRIIKVTYALSLPHDHPAYKLARQRFPKASPEFEDPEEAKRQRISNLERMVNWHISTGNNSLDEVDDFCDTHLNGLNVVDVLTSYLDLLDVHTSPEIDNISAIIDQYSQVTILELSVSLDDGSTITRGIRVYPDGSPPSISHDGFTINNRLVGKNIARRMLRGSLNLADKIGASSIKVQAGMDSGGYVWAKYGATPTEISLENLLASLKHKISNLPDVIADFESQSEWTKQFIRNSINKLRRDYALGTISKDRVRSRIRDLLIKHRFNQQTETTVKNAREYIANNPTVVSQIADLLNTESNKYQYERNPYILNILARGPLGKILLLGTSWSGSFETERDTLGRHILEDSLK